MTTKNEWVAYTGSDEQIAEMYYAKHGYAVKYSNGAELIYNGMDDEYLEDCTHYWIIPDDPLREMKIRQAMTGQPVYVKTPSKRAKDKFSYYKTTNPNWDEIGSEYSFTPFEDTSK